MGARTYLIWFLGTVTAAVIAIAAFNAWSDRYILHHPAGPSFQTVSGFERVLKPAWLDSIKPDAVFIGTSDIRQGFDPVLIDKAYGVRAFNYGFSSVTAYETRRMIQDAAAQPQVRSIFVSANSFAGGSIAQPTTGGFDELRLGVTAQGQPTPRRSLWLFTSRYLSGGATGMHATGLYMLARLKPGESAQDRPDIFGAYSHMTRESFARDMARRAGRSYSLSDWQREQLRAALDAVCEKPIHLFLFFPPEHFAVVDRYLANDAAGLLAFKLAVLEDVRAHNEKCAGKASLFDFMSLNGITGEGPDAGGVYPDYIDLVHFTPRMGTVLTGIMLGTSGLASDADLTGEQDAQSRIRQLLQEDAVWRSEKR
jgi:hypothetical protein